MRLSNSNFTLSKLISLNKINKFELLIEMSLNKFVIMFTDAFIIVERKKYCICLNVKYR